MPAGIVLRTIEPHERDGVLDLLSGWLSRDFFARYFNHDPSFRDDLCFVAADAGRLVSTLQVFRKHVRVDGAVLAVGCVGNVYTAPAYRKAGLAAALLERAIAAMRAHGFDVSLLFAELVDFYGRLGWECVPRYLSFIEPATSSGAMRADSFEPDRDLDGVMAVYAAHSDPIVGATVRDRAYWAGQLGYAGNPDERFVVARTGSGVVAYARATTLYEFNCLIEHGCLPGAEPALAELIAALHCGAATGSLAQLVPSALETPLTARGLTVKSVEDRSWMWRVIDAERFAATLRVPEAAVRREGFFAEIFPAERTRYWLSDRF
jgi:GNAT superfamily N-acetyltransferase